MNDPNLLSVVLDLAGGEIVGRVRLQKIFFLLDNLGLDSGLEYEYHHYGPYSDELADELFDATCSGLVEERHAYRLYDGARYSVFHLTQSAPGVSGQVGGLPRDEAVAFVDLFKDTDATVLELAATIVWLRDHEEVEDWEAELKTRKGSKASDARIQKATSLLAEVGL
jgi:uncharacterized protein YwgA